MGGGRNRRRGEVGLSRLAPCLLQEALLQLFSRGTSDYFSLGTLAAFSTIYFASAIFTYGIFIPSGLFARALAASRARSCAASARAASTPACTHSWGRLGCWAG